MKFTFLGTGTSQGVPVISCSCAVCQSSNPRDQRLRTSGLLQAGKTSLVFDTGPDFRQQMLRAQVKTLDAVVYTHEHKDHVAGLDDIRAFNFYLGRDMDLYATDRVQQRLKQEFAYIFDPDEYPGVPRVVLHNIDSQPFTIQDIELTPIPVMHWKMPVLGFRVGNFAYVTDANYIPPASMAKLRNLDILVLNALRQKAHYSHFTLAEALQLVEELAPRQAYFTHISHDMGLHAAVSQHLPPHVALAHDGLVLEC